MNPDVSTSGFFYFKKFLSLPALHLVEILKKTLKKVLQFQNCPLLLHHQTKQ